MIHILVDSYGCSSDRINNLMDVYEVINKVVNQNGLKAIMPPQLIPYYYCRDERDVGISAYILLKGGHFTIHTFPKWGCYFADLLYDGFVDKDSLEAFLEREFPCDSLFIRRVDRDDELDVEDMGIYQKNDFGPHYMIRSRPAKVPTLGEYMELLDNLPEKAGMHPITRPCVLHDTIKNPTYLSGIAVIAESHIAMHYNYKTGEVFMDVFSCKEVEEDKYKQAMQEIFGGDYEDVCIQRGKRNQQRMDSQENRYDSHKGWQDVIKG
ncbi:MAG: S-adenosylmethionine decarboxylase [Clostridia bacterium]|nr:S-adenosylmethionine decarboxylase [Clostridia bacterium]